MIGENLNIAIDFKSEHGQYSYNTNQLSVCGWILVPRDIPTPELMLPKSSSLQVVEKKYKAKVVGFIDRTQKIDDYSKLNAALDKHNLRLNVKGIPLKVVKKRVVVAETCVPPLEKSDAVLAVVFGRE